MIFHLLSACILLHYQNPQAISRTSETPPQEIVIQLKKIILPKIPSSATQAKNEYKQVCSNIQSDLTSLEYNLKILYGSTTPIQNPLFRVKANEAQAARFFNEIIYDEIYNQLNKKIVQIFNNWAYLRSRYSPSPTSQDSPYNSIQFNPSDIDLINKLHTITSDIISDEKSSELLNHWTMLSNHLHASLERFSNWDNPMRRYHSKDILDLKKHAKIELLERCRYTLWLCEAIWSRMASQSEPTALKELYSKEAHND